ncbi:hypothetical protein [Polyangium sp. 15x6]|uniref:hypothetical protein n=1 Tax=Polyangium sp. 15x6 TaxID=3042687 RepID=UPI00249A21BE|nr:hypothetical protein [Polyangium sp. 15x6]MDI3283868.1 hypothetical protein [Polyangium sp. 15x6]
MNTQAKGAALLPFVLFVPFLLFGLPAGAVVDRLPRRFTMIICDASQAVIFLTVAALAVLGALSFPLLLVLVALAGTATLFFQVSYTSYLLALCPDPRDFKIGNARLFFSESVSPTLGIRDGLVQRWAAARGRVLSPCPSTPTGAPSAPEED